MAKKKLITIILTVVMICSTSFTTYAAPQNLDVQKQNAEEKLKKNQTDLKAAEKKVVELEESIQALDSQIENTLRDIEKNNVDIKNTQNAIKVSEGEVEKAKNEISKQQRLLDNRIIAMYKNGNASYLSIILNSKGFSELLSNIDTISRVVKFDKEVVSNLEENKRVLDAKKKKLDEQNQNLLNLKADNEKKLSKLNDNKKEQSKLIQEAKRQQDLLEDKVNVSKQDLDKTLKILKYISEATDESSSVKNIGDAVKALQSMGSSEAYVQDAIAKGKAIILKKQQAEEAKKNQNKSSSNNKGNSSSGNKGDNISRGDGKPSASAMNVVNYSFKFIGVPYLWGGETPSGFDCSGFVRYCYAHSAGIYLTRTTYTQINEGTPVSRGSLAPGDLVFFGKGSEPDHVGMYIGNGQFIHAPRTGDFIKISSLEGRTNYIGARRIIK